MGPSKRIALLVSINIPATSSIRFTSSRNMYLESVTDIRASVTSCGIPVRVTIRPVIADRPMIKVILAVETEESLITVSNFFSGQRFCASGRNPQPTSNP